MWFSLRYDFKDLGVGCHLNGMFVGAFSYADNVTLLASTNMALKAMLNKCTELAASHNLLFNASKTKCMPFNGHRSQHRAFLNSWVRQLIL